MSECTHDCNGCAEDCASRKSTEDFTAPQNKLSSVKKVIGIVSGKGGVGKSSVTSMLASVMQRRGFSTAVLDADLTGPSIPRCFGIHEKAKGNDEGLFPVSSKFGTKIMSVNLLLEDENAPVVWRGPVIAGAIKQFWSDVMWGDVDYMFVDLPPGTGDAPLTVFQSLPLDGIIIVTSPQQMVSMIVSKAAEMAKMMNVKVLGVIENYSFVRCPDCKQEFSIFGVSHTQEVCDKYGFPLLANLPIDPALANACDKGIIELYDCPSIEPVADEIEKIKK